MLNCSQKIILYWRQALYYNGRPHGGRSRTCVEGDRRAWAGQLHSLPSARNHTSSELCLGVSASSCDILPSQYQKEGKSALGNTGWGKGRMTTFFSSAPVPICDPRPSPPLASFLTSALDLLFYLLLAAEHSCGLPHLLWYVSGREHP